MKKPVKIKKAIFLTLFIFAVFSISESQATAEEFQRNLKLGDVGDDVKELQIFLNKSVDTQIAVSGVGSPGNETRYFGSLTKASVIRFQNKYRIDVLHPIGLSYGTGYVGEMTLDKLNNLSTVSKSQNGNSEDQDHQTSISTNSVGNTQIKTPDSIPKVFSVSPERVKRGDVVTVLGENFTSIGNTVYFRFGEIEASFGNLTSSDGKTLSFVYEPPNVKTMSKDELMALPPYILSQITGPLEKAGGSIDDLVDPYRNLKNEEELSEFMENNGRSFSELYDPFHIAVENSNGSVESLQPLVSGLRKLEFGGGQTSMFGKFLSSIKLSFQKLIPEAVALAPYGGFNVGMVLQCTCGPGYLTFMTDFSNSGGTGLYWIYPGFRPISGNPRISGFYVGKFIRGGQCAMNAGPSCFTITANMPVYPWGESGQGGY